jgi:hypothetical protein
MNNAPPTEVEEISAVEAARRLGIDLNRVYGLLRVGRLEGHKTNSKWYVSGVAVQKRLQKFPRRGAMDC